MRILDILSLAATISFVSVWPPLCLAVIQWRKLHYELALLRWILVVSFLSDILTFPASLFFGNSYIVGNLFLVIHFLLVMMIFRQSHANKKYVLYIITAYLVFFVIDVVFWEDLLQLSTNAIILSSIIVIIFSLLYLYKLLNELTITHIQRLPMLWIVFAVLLYYACTMFVMLTNNYVMHNYEDSQPVIWIVHNVFNVIKNILFAVALWKNHRWMKSSIS